MSHNARLHRLAAVAGLLFLSGGCALVYQTGWMREFRLVFGGTTAACAAVSAVFMGGIGLGSAILGRRTDRTANPLRLYAFLEIAIALAAGASPWLIDLVGQAYVLLGGQVALGSTGGTGVRFVLAALVLGVPTCLMGGTLPAAIRAVITPEDRMRNGAAILYGVNTLGAVAGTAMSTFVLLPWLGTRGTLWLAALANGGVGAVAWVWSRRVAFLAIGRGEATMRQARRSVVQASSKARLQDARGKLVECPSSSLPVYLAAGIVGFAFFLMELVWYRMLGPILGGTTFTFGLILTVALLGIGLGGAAYAILSRRLAPSLAAFAATCSLEAACIAIPFAMGDRLALLAAEYGAEAVGFGGQVVGWAVVASLVVFPAAFVSGIQFPLLLALAGQGEKEVGKQVGLTLASNTLGAILGSLTGGFGLLPLLTAPGAWIAVVVLLILLAISTLLLATGRRGVSREWLIPVGAAAVAAVCLWSEGPTAAWRHSGIGAGRFQLPQGGANVIQHWSNTKCRQVLWQAEGVEASVALVADDGLSFFVNGKSDGSATGDAGTQIMLGVLPAMLHASPKSGLVVGLGTGETPGWLAEVPSIERVVVVELEPAVDEMARRCAPVNHDVLNHPKVRRIYNDARDVLLTTTDRYDLIASEPSNPYRAGVANLFTQEFYEACRARLEEGGLFVQWVQGYEIDESTIRTIAATLRSVFAHVEVWQTKPDDMLWVCSPRPFHYPVERIRQRTIQEPFRSALACGWRVTDLEGVFSRFVAGPRLIDKIAHEEKGRLNKDDRNQIEYDFAKTVGKSTGFSIDELHRKAVLDAAHRPSLDDGSRIDWKRVESHRQVLFGLTEQIVLPPAPSPEHTARAEILKRYWKADMKGMTAAWEKAGYEPVFPTETALLALGYADLGDDRAQRLLAELRAFQPLEADAIESYLLFKQGKISETAELLERVFGQLRTKPWGLSHALELCFKLAAPVAQADRARAPRLYQLLREPLAVYIYEESRCSAALAIAQMVSLDAQLEALAAYEPHIPWTEDFLTLRSRIYDGLNHPLQDQARADMESYRRQMVPQRRTTAFRP